MDDGDEFSNEGIIIITIIDNKVLLCKRPCLYT